jgi:integrase/recombinase XerD
VVSHAHREIVIAGTVHHLSQVRAEPALLSTVITGFLADLEQAGRSRHTRRAYASDLAQLTAMAPERVADLTPEVLRLFFSSQAHLAASTRARRQASVASFSAWAYREGLLVSDPMGRVLRIRTEQPPPRGFTPGQVSAFLAAVPASRLRDRLLFTLLATTGLRVGEALGLDVDDLHLDRDDERLTVLGKGGRHRTVLLDDPTLLRLLRRYLRETGYQHGPLFRAERGTSNTPLRYQSVQARFSSYLRTANLTGSLHDLRHAHAQALVNGGVSLATIRKRLGHANINTTLRYAEQSDATADGEMRRWQRTKNAGSR